MVIKAVGYELLPGLEARAHALAQTLHLTIDQQALPRLMVTAERLVLLLPQFLPLYADFTPKYWQKRRDAGKKQGLVRACKPRQGIRILDATAGWGRDAAVLASFGAQTLMLEREPIMAALLADALACMHQHSSSLNLSLIAMDTQYYLQSLKLKDFPDVIYIDPMHPVREKSALVKKDMQALQQCIGEDKDALALLTLALTKARERVVVKWPQRLAPLIPPTMSIPGKTVRFDIYIIKTQVL